MVLEVADANALVRAAVEHVEGDDSIPDEQRTRTLSAVGDELDGAAEAIAYPVDPIGLVSDAPGVELAQATWSSETLDAGELGLADGAWFDDLADVEPVAESVTEPAAESAVEPLVEPVDESVDEPANTPDGDGKTGNSSDR